MKKLIYHIKSLQLKDIIISMILIALPFLSEFWRYIPKTKTINIGWFTIHSNGFSDISVLAWMLNYKLILIFGLSIWRLTTTHWWKNAILIPLTIEIYKLINVTSTEVSNVDVNEFYFSLPITIPIILVLAYLSRILNKAIVIEYYKNKISDEIDNIFLKLPTPKNSNEIEKEFNDIKKIKDSLSKEAYLSYLVNLRKKILTDEVF